MGGSRGDDGDGGAVGDCAAAGVEADMEAGGPAGGAATMAGLLHSCLWAAHAAFWWATLQYLASRQRPQRKLPISGQPGSPHGRAAGGDATGAAAVAIALAAVDRLVVWWTSARPCGNGSCFEDTDGTSLSSEALLFPRTPRMGLPCG